MSKENLRKLLVGVFGLIFSVSMVFMPIYNSTKYDKVTGVITDDYVSRSRKIGSSYGIKFEYEYKGEQYYTSKTIGKIPKKNQKSVGSELEVYVNPKKPEKVSILYGNNYGYIMVIIMLVYNIMIIPACIKDYKENKYIRGGNYES